MIVSSDDWLKNVLVSSSWDDAMLPWWSGAAAVSTDTGNDKSILGITVKYLHSPVTTASLRLTTLAIIQHTFTFSSTNTDKLWWQEKQNYQNWFRNNKNDSRKRLMTQTDRQRQRDIQTDRERQTCQWEWCCNMQRALANDLEINSSTGRHDCRNSQWLQYRLSPTSWLHLICLDLSLHVLQSPRTHHWALDAGRFARLVQFYRPAARSTQLHTTNTPQQQLHTTKTQHWQQLHTTNTPQQLHTTEAQHWQQLHTTNDNSGQLWWAIAYSVLVNFSHHKHS